MPAGTAAAHGGAILACYLKSQRQKPARARAPIRAPQAKCWTTQAEPGTNRNRSLGFCLVRRWRRRCRRWRRRWGSRRGRRGICCGRFSGVANRSELLRNRCLYTLRWFVQEAECNSHCVRLSGINAKDHAVLLNSRAGVQLYEARLGQFKQGPTERSAPSLLVLEEVHPPF